MSTHQSRLVYDRGARPCPRQSYCRPIDVREVAILAVRGQTQVSRESNDSRAPEFDAASNFVSGNTAGMDHAPDIEGGGSNAVDDLLPIYSNTSLPTRY
jgi:hypothetical protein